MTEPEPRAERTLDLDALKGLAHPLRLQIFDLLSIHGAATASGIAERLGESSGATSYHLRQLARHGFVREVEGRGTARERWWERVPGSVSLMSRELDDSPVTRAASDLVTRQWAQNSSRVLEDFMLHGMEDLGPEWTDHSDVSVTNLRLTSEQLEGLIAEWQEHMRPYIETLRGRNDPGSRPVQVHFNAFPVIGGIETRKEASE